LSWERQRSHAYLENKATLTSGERRYALEQLFSAQQVEGNKELMFKLMLADLAAGKEYKVDYAQQVT